MTSARGNRNRRGVYAVLLCVLVFICFCLALCGCSSRAAEPLPAGQAIPLTGVKNARDLGGWTAGDGRTVKHGMLLRTAKLTDATEEDIRTLREDYRLAVVVDLRMESEAENAPDPQIEGVTYRNITIMDPDGPGMTAYNARIDGLLAQGVEADAVTRLRFGVECGVFTNQMYVDFLSSEIGKAGYRQFFRELLALPEGEALLFHCTQGKDRTGCAAMLILSALGVDEETMLGDYLLTNEFNAGLIAEERAYLQAYGIDGDELDLYMIGLDQVNPEQMQNALSWMRENYGSPLGYITQALGVTDAELAALREKFLE